MEITKILISKTIETKDKNNVNFEEVDISSMGIKFRDRQIAKKIVFFFRSFPWGKEHYPSITALYCSEESARNFYVSHAAQVEAVHDSLSFCTKHSWRMNNDELR